MFLGYNTNGFAHHRLSDAIGILAALGYRGVGLTLDVHHLDPFAPDRAANVALIRNQLEHYQLSCVIETGARFLLDPVRKHQPTLVCPLASDRQTRLDYLKDCLAIGRELNAKCVSFWSGTATEAASHEIVMQQLVEACQRLADVAASMNQVLAFEPEPGMFIDTMEKFAELQSRVNHPAFGLTIDIGHLICNGERPVSRILTDWQHLLWNIHIEDMRRGIHDHLMFGEGEVDFEDVFAGLRNAGYSGGVFVELSRHSYDAVQTARRAKCFLDRHLFVK
jgi:sugar phosphate isomerase/epimerase